MVNKDGSGLLEERTTSPEGDETELQKRERRLGGRFKS